MNYWIFAPSVAFGLLAVAAVLHANDSRRNAKKWAYEEWKERYEGVRKENRRLEVESALNVCYADGLEQDNERLNGYADQVVALNADLHDALLDAQNQIKALRMATVEIPSVIAKTPARPKRTKKAASSNE